MTGPCIREEEKKVNNPCSPSSKDKPGWGPCTGKEEERRVWASMTAASFKFPNWRRMSKDLTGEMHIAMLLAKAKL